MQDLKISVAQILGRPGEYRDVAVRARVGGITTAVATVDAPVEAALRLESVVEGVLVSGGVNVPAMLHCARCLATFSSTVDFQLCELFVTRIPSSSEPELYRISGTDIDLEPMLRDAVALALPLAPLCHDGCRGLCARCGRDLNEADCNCTEDDVDPRWAGLSALRAKLES